MPLCRRLLWRITFLQWSKEEWGSWRINDKITSELWQAATLYFWTSSPALPPSALGFEPTPTIVIRPADDQHLPTANTCISRLYLPLYSSRQILREKLLSAIETRSFGFV
ncbi:E3 ubiquitin-protein ligase ubr5 [Hymenolepis weldensis]